MIVRYMGGIGNQMFHYAFGRGVSTMRNEALAFSRRFFKLGPSDGLLRSFTYCMDAWNIREYKTVDETGSVVNDAKFGYFMPQVYTAPPNATYVGPWQSEMYFKNVENEIRAEFTLRERPSDESLRVADQIREAGELSAFFHVRRGDYLYGNNPQFHGAPTLDYYRRAQGELRNYLGWYPKVFVFSDDPAWCRQNFGEAFTIVDHNPPSSEDGKTQGREHEDLWLMSLCQHAVIANSSFSWFGAWLGDTKKDRKVFAPQRWLGPNNPQEPGPDLIPERWTKLEN